MQQILKTISGFFLDIFETLVIALSIFLIVYLFLMQPHQVNGQSMVPNFQHGDYVLTDKISYRLGAPKRGDVIVFHAPASAHCPQGSGCDFIKRIIGMPNETVQVINGNFYINGQLLEEPYLSDESRTKTGQYLQNQEIKLGSTEYFVVGDNRDYSSDSRAWGPIDASMIVGKAFFRYWPPETMGFIEHINYNY